MAEPENAASEPRIRSATTADLRAVEQIVEDAYCVMSLEWENHLDRFLMTIRHELQKASYGLSRKAPSSSASWCSCPSLTAYFSTTSPLPPAWQGHGSGRQLLAFAETEAVRRGYREIRLYTHETMTADERLYAAIGYEEIGRCTEAGIRVRLYAEATWR
jgi:GNAT superfamily N-acetyltransferase